MTARRCAVLVLACLAACETGGTGGSPSDGHPVDAHLARPSFLTSGTAGTAATAGLRLTVDSPTVTSTGWAVGVHYTAMVAGDSLLVTAQRGGNAEYAPFARYKAVKAGASYNRTVSVNTSLAAVYTFRARLWNGGVVSDSASAVMAVGVTPPTPPPTLAILSADTTVSTRTVGDTTFTTRTIITTRGTVDTARTVTFVVTPPAPPLNPYQLDSVKLTTPAIPIWDTTKTKVSLSYYIYPHPAAMTYTVRWFINGVLVKTATSQQLTSAGGSTLQFVNTGYASMIFVACARMSPDTQAHEKCSAPVTWTAPISSAPPPTDTTTPAPTTSTWDPAKPLVVLGVAALTSDSTVAMPVWLQWPSGSHIALNVDVLPTSATSPFAPPLTPAYPALLRADTLPIVAFPAGIGPICPMGAAGGGTTTCVRVSGMTAAELTRGVVLTFEAPPKGSSKLVSGCALIYTGTLVTDPMVNHLYDNVPGVSFCTPLMPFYRDSAMVAVARFP